MKSAAICVLGLITLLIASGCTTTPTATEGDAPAPTKNFDEYRTFAVAPFPPGGPASDPGAAAQLKEVARNAIVETLTAKGFTETDPANADFVVKVQTEFYRDPFIESSEKRHVMIDFHDRQNDAIIWSNQRGRSSSRSLDAETLRKTIAQMLASVPSPAAR